MDPLAEVSLGLGQRESDLEARQVKILQTLQSLIQQADEELGKRRGNPAAGGCSAASSTVVTPPVSATPAVVPNASGESSDAPRVSAAPLVRVIMVTL